MIYEVRPQIDEAIDRLQEIARERREKEPYETPLMRRFLPGEDGEIRATFKSARGAGEKEIAMDYMKYVRLVLFSLL